MSPKEDVEQERTESNESKESTRITRSKTRSYDENDFEDGPIKLGDRVIIKEKYLGTCRFIGPIEEKVMSEELFVGIELDDNLTKNSGVFGSRQYFECDYGYGIMVQLKKVKKVKDYTKKESSRTKNARSKSISDINRLKIRNDDGKTIRKVSPGYDFIKKDFKRSKSSSNLDKCKLMPKGTLEILEDYKSFQERERDALKSMYSSGYGYYNDIDHIYDTMGLDYSAQDCPYPEWDQMRQSFSKIVKPRNVAPRYRSYSTTLEDTLPHRSSFGSFDSGTNLHWPTFGTTYDDGSFQQTVSNISSSRRTSVTKPRKKTREVVTVRKYALASDRSSDSSGVGSYDEPPKGADVMPDEPLLQAYVALRKNICDECAHCTKCAPPSIIPIDDVGQIGKMEYLPVNTCPDAAVKTSKKNRAKERKNSKMESRRNSALKSDRRPTVQTLVQQWRAKHGCSMEAGMTRGLNRLMYAINS